MSDLHIVDLGDGTKWITDGASFGIALEAVPDVFWALKEIIEAEVGSKRGDGDAILNAYAHATAAIKKAEGGND